MRFLNKLHTLAASICIVAALLPSPTLAQQATYSGAAAAGKQLGNDNKGVPNAAVSNSSPAALVPGFSGTTNNTTLFQGGQQTDLATHGTGAVNRCLSATDPACQAVQTMVVSPTSRPEFKFDANDPLYRDYKGIVGRPDQVAGNIASEYSTCTTTTVKDPPELENHVCSDFSVLENKTCLIGQAIQVDPDYIYRCQETIQTQANRQCTIGRIIKIDTDYNYQCYDSPNKVNRYTCNRTLTVSCTGGGDGCDAGGIVPTSTESDMAFTWSQAPSGFYYLDWGTIGNDYWTGPRTQGKQYDRTLRFTVKDKNKISNFILEATKFDDWVGIWINDNLVFVGPTQKTGGLTNKNWDRLEMGALYQSSTRQYSGSSCQQNGSSWNCNGTTYPLNQCKCINESSGESGGGCFTYACGPAMATSNGNPAFVRYGPSATQTSQAELNLNSFESLWYEAKQFLVTGVNTIKMRVIVGVEGEGWVRFTTKQACPDSCTTAWVNGCTALENRSR